MNRDPYEVLGLSRDASQGEVKKAFRRVARELHPDVNRDDPHAEERFKEAAEAHEILSDQERRAIYDRYGHEGLSSRGYAPDFGGFGSFADIFDAFFGGAGAGFGRSGFAGGAVQGGDVAVAMEVTLAEAATGTSATVEYDVVGACEHCRGNGAEPGTPIETCERCGGRGQLRSVARSAFGQLVRAHACEACGGEGKLARTPCTRCQGRGREARRRTLEVDVPAGIADEQRIRITGEGHAGERGGPSGDLYVLVRVGDDERFVRDGNDLVTVVDLPAPQAALGTRVSVPTLDGVEEEVEIAAGTQPGTVLRLAGRGMPSLRRGARGDQRIVVNVMVPRRLTAEQRELVERLAESMTDDNLHDRREESVFQRARRALR
jgi:molecular chaperone DnaJ